MTTKSILQTQLQTLRLFLDNPSTRTPTIVTYVASFGGALHAAVTTFFYLSIGASTTDIGQLGFIMSAGALVGSPVSGWALDRYGPWIPISVTAISCAVGCLWRGVATSITSLRIGAILLGIGVNLWTVVLAHLVKSFPSKMRSEVLAGFSVQMTTLQLCGKGVFPVIEYVLHSVVQIEEELIRYRIHMGLCTFFCFYGVVALLVDRKNVGSSGATTKMSQNEQQLQQQSIKYEHKHSDPIGDDDWRDDFLQPVGASNPLDGVVDSTAPKNDVPEHESLHMQESIVTRQNKRKHLITTALLTIALLIQSISTTFLTVLWPLLSKDLFSISAHTFGIITFISSIVSTGAVASFPIVEKMEKIGGRIRCAALGFGAGAILCFIFCYCSFGELLSGGEELDFIYSSDGHFNEVDGRFAGSDIQNIGIQKQLRSRDQLILHAVSAILLQSTLCFLEPSLKSLLSLSTPSTKETPSKGSSLGFTMGYLTMLGNIGGMIGNIASTWMYKLSTETTQEPWFGKGGSLPFLVTGLLLSISAVMIWQLNEPPINEVASSRNDTEAKIDLELGSPSLSVNDPLRETLEGSDDEKSDGCCVTLRETTYDLKLD